MPTDPLAPVLALAERQHALIRRHQALEVVTPRCLDRQLAAGRLCVPWPSIYRVPGAPRTAEQALLAAVWAAGEGPRPTGVRRHGSGACWRRRPTLRRL